jgi:hypothetical protein
MKKLLNGLWRKVAFWAMGTRLYAWGMSVIPYVRFTTYYGSVRGWKYRQGHELLLPGDIILTKDNWKLSTFIIPGELPHAALCVRKSPQEEFEIAEMTCIGFKKSEFYDLCHEADRVVILRCIDWDTEYVEQVVDTCLAFEGTNYDNSFELGVKALYCSELIVASDPEKRLDVSYDDLIGLGRPYISPTGILHGQNVKLVWDSDNADTIRVLQRIHPLAPDPARPLIVPGLETFVLPRH